MSIEHLVQMANSIGDYFSAFPETEALDGIANHLKRFWTPRMRESILAHVDTAGGDGLRPQVRNAIVRARDLLLSKPQPTPARNDAA